MEIVKIIHNITFASANRHSWFLSFPHEVAISDIPPACHMVYRMFGASHDMNQNYRVIIWTGSNTVSEMAFKNFFQYNAIQKYDLQNGDHFCQAWRY